MSMDGLVSLHFTTFTEHARWVSELENCSSNVCLRVRAQQFSTNSNKKLIFFFTFDSFQSLVSLSPNTELTFIWRLVKNAWFLYKKQTACIRSSCIRLSDEMLGQYLNNFITYRQFDTISTTTWFKASRRTCTHRLLRNEWKSNTSCAAGRSQINRTMYKSGRSLAIGK